MPYISTSAWNSIILRLVYSHINLVYFSMSQEVAPHGSNHGSLPTLARRSPSEAGSSLPTVLSTVAVSAKVEVVVAKVGQSVNRTPRLEDAKTQRMLKGHRQKGGADIDATLPCQARALPNTAVSVCAISKPLGA